MVGSSNLPKPIMQFACYIGAGLATISIAGAGVGIGNLFAGFLRALAARPELESTLFNYCLLGFALTEAIALFGLMVTFMLLFAFQ